MSFAKRDQTLGLSPPALGLRPTAWGSLGLSPYSTVDGLAYPTRGRWLLLCGPDHRLANTTRSPPVTVPCYPVLCRTTQPHGQPASKVGPVRVHACAYMHAHTHARPPSLCLPARGGACGGCYL